jgi:hypothetical protein
MTTWFVSVGKQIHLAGNHLPDRLQASCVPQAANASVKVSQVPIRNTRPGIVLYQKISRNAMDSMPVPRAGRLWNSKADFFRPFRTAATLVQSERNTANEDANSVYFDPAHCSTEMIRQERGPDLRDLNAALAALVDVFPTIQPDVFREMLTNVSVESRLEIVTEHLLQREAKWVRGRFRTPGFGAISRSSGRLSTANTTEPHSVAEHVLSSDDHFRSEAYCKAVKQVFYQEFRSLSHSTIKGVLAEQNFSYKLARPILHQLATRGWRFSIPYFWSRPATAPTPTIGQPPCVVWLEDARVKGKQTLHLKRTGSVELDLELYEMFVAAPMAKYRQEIIAANFVAASQINEAEATEVGALFDCECCYGSYTFEEIASCTEEGHLLCHECVRRTVNEALYGQGWSRTADLHRATVRCFASASQDCGGHLKPDAVRRALNDDVSRTHEQDELWTIFQNRLSADMLVQSHLTLQRCSSCDYAEVDETPVFKLRHPLAIWHYIGTRTTAAFQLAFLCGLVATSVFANILFGLLTGIYILLSLFPGLSRVLHSVLTRIYRRRRSNRFSCKNPTCLKVTCMRCNAIFRDPHTCFESEKTSLRTAIETSATAAIKRTCPRCLLSFIKDSGCNKLVCNCGYTMCYICRQEITVQEGYGHFCQHFRPAGGRCTECFRCDLYGDEDEEESIRAAVEEAEKAWRARDSGGVEGNSTTTAPSADEEATRRMMEDVVGGKKSVKWLMKQWMDAVVEACFTWDITPAASSNGIE